MPPAQVGIAQASSYDPALVLRQVQNLFDSLGGLKDVVRPGDKVAIKVNLTGGVKGNIPPPGTTAPESYVTHPVVVRAMGELAARNVTGANEPWVPLQDESLHLIKGGKIESPFWEYL